MGNVKRLAESGIRFAIGVLNEYGGAPLLAINGGPPVKCVPSPRRMARNYDALAQEKEERLTVVVSYEEFAVAYGVTGYDALVKKTATLDGRDYRVAEFNADEYAHEIVLIDDNRG